jgi:hypothetical protein
MKPIRITAEEMERSLAADEMQDPAIWNIWNLASGTDEIDGYGVHHPQLTLEKARAVALVLSSKPGPFWITVERHNGVYPMSYEDRTFSFILHKGPAHQKMTAIAAMRAEVPA